MEHSFPRASRRRMLQWTAAAWAAGASPWSRAQGAGPLKILVGFAPGGSADQTARLVADQLRVHLNRPVIVENRTGAGGRVMVEQAKQARADGSTLMLVPHGPITLFPHIYRSLRYDPMTDFIPVGRVCTFDYGLATGPATAAASLEEYLRWARDPNHKASFGSPGAGTIPHFIGQEFGRKEGLRLTHVPYRGAAPSVIDLIGGTVSLVAAPLADLSEHHKAGKIRVLATTGAEPTRVLQDVPTLKQKGVDLAMDGWYGLYAPAGTPAPVMRELNQALVASAGPLAEPFARMALTAAATSSEELARLQRSESDFWARLIQSSGFKPED